MKILSLDSNNEKASNGLSNYQHSNNIGSLIFLGDWRNANQKSIIALGSIH